MSIKVDDGGSYYCLIWAIQLNALPSSQLKNRVYFVISFHTSANNAHLHYLHCIYRT